MAPRPVKTPGSKPYPRWPDGTEIDQFWACYMDDITECGVARRSKSMFAKYFSDHIYKSFKDALASYESYRKSACAQREPRIPWEYIDEPERYNLTLKGTVIEKQDWLLGTRTPIEGVAVTCDGNTTTTTGEGKFSLYVHYGNHDFTLTKEGYKPWFRNFSFTRLIQNIGQLTMEPENPAL